MTAPDKIWIQPTEKQPRPTREKHLAKWVRGSWKDHDGSAAGDVEYTLSDLIPAMLAEARAEGRAEGLREALDNRPAAYAIYGADRTDRYAKGYCGGVEGYHKTILSLIDATAPTPAQHPVHERYRGRDFAPPAPDDTPKIGPYTVTVFLGNRSPKSNFVSVEDQIRGFLGSYVDPREMEMIVMSLERQISNE